MKTIHHLYPRNAVDGIGLNTDINKVLLDNTRHVNYHRVFGNLEFHNQILYILDFNSKIVQENTCRRVADIMNEDFSYIYKNGVFIPRKY